MIKVCVSCILHVQTLAYLILLIYFNENVYIQIIYLLYYYVGIVINFTIVYISRLN